MAQVIVTYIFPRIHPCSSFDLPTQSDTYKSYALAVAKRHLPSLGPFNKGMNTSFTFNFLVYTIISKPDMASRYFVFLKTKINQLKCIDTARAAPLLNTIKK